MCLYLSLHGCWRPRGSCEKSKQFYYCCRNVHQKDFRIQDMHVQYKKVVEVNHNLLTSFCYIVNCSRSLLNVLSMFLGGLSISQ